MKNALGVSLGICALVYTYLALEVIAVIGAAVVISVYPILPYALAFAAGAMIFIVVENVVPESHRGGNVDIASIGLILGFIVMMILDVSLG